MMHATENRGTTAFAGLVRKEFLHIFRDRRTMLILLGMPLVLITLFGFALSTEIDNINVAVVAPVRNDATERIAQALAHNRYFTFKGYLGNSRQVEQAMQCSQIDAAIIFSGNIATATLDGAAIQIATDAANPNTGSIEALYLSGVVADVLSLSQISSTTASRGGITTSVNMLYNPLLSSSYNFVPGIMGLILILICAMMTSISIVREKETGTMEVLLVSPVRPINIIVAKMIPYLVLSCVNLITILLLARFVLHVPIAGSIGWVGVLSLLYIALALTLGLLISTLVTTQVAAMLISGMVLMMPMIMLSDMLFPVESMPRLLQWLSCVVPARWYVAGLRKMMIEGLGVRYALREFIILAVMTLFCLVVALKKFKNRIE